jgi:2-C-methyl-D-erythritol 2,4-cyclodiphosphate synthase
MFRIGQGYDIHATQPGDGIVIGGVQVPCEMAFIAHSDGDVLIHAVCDALLGASNCGDIGDMFPDTDPQYKGIDSKILLREVVKRVHAKGYRVVNVDCTVILQRPKLYPYKKAIAQSLADMLDITIDDVTVKAKTKEKQDATGQGKAVEALCATLLTKSQK